MNLIYDEKINKIAYVIMLTFISPKVDPFLIVVSLLWLIKKKKNLRSGVWEVENGPMIMGTKCWKGTLVVQCLSSRCTVSMKNFRKIVI